MAKTSGEEQEATKALKIQTWVLKVPIHCQGCKRKVRKVLQAIDGVYTTTVDSQQQRVTVTGNVGVQTLIKKLIKIGKHAEIWPEKLTTKQEEEEEEKEGKAKNKHKQKDPSKAKSLQNDTGNNDNGTKRTVRFSGEGFSPSQGTENGGKSPGNSIAGDNLPNKGSQSDGDGGKSGGKRTKKKGRNGNNENCSLGLSLGSGSTSLGSAAGTGCQTRGVDMGQVVGQINLNPTSQHSFKSPQSYYYPAMYASNYSMAGPIGIPASFQYYNVPPAPYAHVTNTHQTTPLECLDIFNDENVNGCSIM